MLRIISLIMLSLVIYSAHLPGAQALEQTKVFQQGLNGYTGARDTWISKSTWATPPQNTVNHGQHEELHTYRLSRDKPLIRFDLNSIPSNSHIVSATLSLYNLTPSSSTGQDSARRSELYQVLVNWDEGNQVESPIQTSGAHGATGYNAFEYYPGEGTNVSWGEVGMAAGEDYAEKPESYADVVNEGWYAWDITDLVRTWVRGEQNNFGVVLVDISGYQEGHTEWREFVSSQGVTPDQRPKLVIVYNPDVPCADAGLDQENLTWNGGMITLDGSSSHDRPGGNDATLTYSWLISQAAYGSAMSGALPGTTAITNFTPDMAGEWDIELTVTNDLGETGTDTIHLRLLSIPCNHPRIYLTSDKVAVLKAQAVQSNPRWAQLKAEADEPAGQYNMQSKALVGKITGIPSYCDEAIGVAMDMIADPYEWTTKAGDIALVFDWCYDRLSTQQITQFVGYFNAWGDDIPKGEDTPGWENYWPRYGYSYALIGLASYGDNPRAQEWLDEYRHRRYRDNDLSLLSHIADGGAWPEGMVYDWIANWPRVKAVEAWRTATGEDLFESTGWFRNRLAYILLHHWPGEAKEWGKPYRPYVSTGDSERNRGTMTNYERIMALILVGRYSGDPLASQLQAYLAAPPANSSWDFLCHEEFLWFDPNMESTTPQILTHYASGTGTLFMRSGWPDGAADTNTSPTYATFQCGDHFSYHQHYDQNSFTLFKYGDLAVDSGVYSGEGLSNHDINYYVRTIAHNTLVVYNPQEDFSRARPDASSNDGGQRSMAPASRSPRSIDYFNQYITQYDTGDILRYEDHAHFTYALGDATKAYNNPTYNQAMSGSSEMSGNVAKVSRFQREFVYLRPQSSSDTEYMVLFDRVGVTQPTFSGENTKLLFHTLNEPVINGTESTISAGETLYTNPDLATAVSGNGKLFMKFLLPSQRNVRKVGGRGVKAFWVFDANYDWHWDQGAAQPRPTTDFDDVPYGEWRLELEPADTALEHNFLTVLQPTSTENNLVLESHLITATGMAGAHISGASMNHLVLFSTANDGSPPSGTITYSYPKSGQTLNLLFDLQPGSGYDLVISLTAGQQLVNLSPDVNGSSVANERGILVFMDSTSIVDGDVAPLGSRDGVVNVGDALVCLRFALGLETATQDDMQHGDVAPLDASGQPNPDGVLNVGDALVILRKALGIVLF